MSKSHKKIIAEYVAQALLIVFSVVLGLYLNERISQYNQYQESQKLLSHIKFEIKENAELLNDWHDYHREVYEKVDAFSQSEPFLEKFIADKNTLFAETLSRGTMIHKFPSNAAWEISKSNPDISKISHENMILLSTLYNQQDITFQPFDEMLKLFNQPDVNAPEYAQANLMVISQHLREIVAREAQLMRFYDQAHSTFDIE